MSRPDRYLIEAAARALDVLEIFNQQDEVRLSEVVEKLGLVKSTAFRLLYTLEAKGLSSDAQTAGAIGSGCDTASACCR